jgi:hypothetical protein
MGQLAGVSWRVGQLAVSTDWLPALPRGDVLDRVLVPVGHRARGQVADVRGVQSAPVRCADHCLAGQVVLGESADPALISADRRWIAGCGFGPVGLGVRHLASQFGQFGRMRTHFMGEIRAVGLGMVGPRCPRPPSVRPADEPSHCQPMARRARSSFAGIRAMNV